MLTNIKQALTGYIHYHGQTHFAFLLHRISGLATLAFLTLHILTTSMVFFKPSWYGVLIEIFRHPVIMLIEIVLSYCVVYHGVNGLRLAYMELFRPDLWHKTITPKIVRAEMIIALVLWLPALVIMGYYLLRHGLGWLGG